MGLWLGASEVGVRLAGDALAGFLDVLTSSDLIMQVDTFKKQWVALRTSSSACAAAAQ